MPEKARGGVFGFLVHTTDVAYDLLQTNYVTETIAGSSSTQVSASARPKRKATWLPCLLGKATANAYE